MNARRLTIAIALFALLAGMAHSVVQAADAQPDAANTLTAEELTEGWLLLFDGKTLFGWKPAADANWAVKDGAITVSDGEKGLLNTTTAFADYRLKVDFRCDPATNSGVFLRTPAKPTDPKSDCYELNIADPANPFPTGSFVGRSKAAEAKPTKDWHTFDVLAQGGRFVVKLDGREVLKYDDPKPVTRGFIGLQLNQGAVEFRNIKLRPLGLASIFNGKDLQGWNADRTGKSAFSVTDKSELNVKNGKGQLESAGKYADFVLQLECFSNGKGLNSGVFFRCIPGDEMMGYESQIHNGFKNGDRTQPVDCGTGGIFRRQNARLVVADDFEWFHKTIIADGPHMAAWVNGIQVSDWTDDRPADDNPRKGQRLTAGTIILQGHDPTTDLSFRNLKIGETAR